MKYYIITGTSRGLGQAFAEELLKDDNCLFCISRNSNEDLIEKAESCNATVHYIPYDLNMIDGLEGLIDQIFSEIDLTHLDEIYLINNAGIMNPVKANEKCKGHEIAKNITVNLIAPMILSSLFIAKVTHVEAEKVIINISSGAGKKPYFGWTSYCTSKAGIDMLTRTIGLEESVKDHPVKVLSIAPGVLDTEMQSELRTSSRDDFPMIDRFIGLKDSHVLSDSKQAARNILQLVKNGFEQGAVLDIRDFT